MGSSASSNDSSSSDSDEDSSGAYSNVGEEEAVSHFLTQDKGQEDELDFREFHLVDLFNSQTLREAVSKVSDVVPETVVQQHHGHLLRWLEERNMRNEETVTVSQFCDVLFNRGVNRKEAEEAFEQFDVDGEGVAYIDSMMEALKSTNGANLRGELSHAIRTLRACSLAPGVIDIFSPHTTELGKHGHRILKYLLRNRAPSNTLPYPALDGFTNITAMRMVVLEQYLKNTQNKKDDSSKDDQLNELKFLNKPYCNIQVSSNRQDVGRLVDGDVSTFWQSDGPAHSHWIRLKMKSGVSLSNLSMLVTRSDQSYMPQHIIVVAGNSPVSMEVIKDIHIPSSYPSDEVLLLENAKVRSRFIQINIKKCQYEGCDVRIHGLKAVGFRAMTGMEVNVAETSAVWYLSVLSATATAAIPMAPHLQSAILENTKTALQQMPPLSLCKLHCKKHSFITPKILDQVEEFVGTVAKNSEGKTSIEGLLLLLQLSLARGNIPSVLKCLMEMHENFNNLPCLRSDRLAWDHPVPGGVKIMKNIENVQSGLLRKHTTVLEPLEVKCSGGSKDAKSIPSNVLTSDWSSEAYISTEPCVTMVFHNPNHSFQLVKLDIKVSKGGLGPKCGMVFIADEVTAMEDFDLNFDYDDLQMYDKWTEEDFRKYKDEREKCNEGRKSELELVAFFSLMDNFDEVEVSFDTYPVGTHLIIKFLRPRLESADRLGILGIRCHGYWRENSLLDRVDIKQPVDEKGVRFDRLLSAVLWFLVTLCHNVEKVNKKEAFQSNKYQSIDFNLNNLQPETLCEFYFQLPHNLSNYLEGREYLLRLFHCSIPHFTKEIERRELLKAEEATNNTQVEGSKGNTEGTAEGKEETPTTILKKMFDHLCQLLEKDIPPLNLGSRVNLASSKVILDGAPIFFPDKESRKKQLFNMIYDPSEDHSSRTVFRSLCWYFGSVDSSGLLDLPLNVLETPVDTSAILSVFDTLLCVAYKEFEEIIEDDDPVPSKECSHVVNLLNALQVNLLTWCHKLYLSESPEAEQIATEVMKDYCKSMYSWICNAVILWYQQGTSKERVRALRYSFLESTFHQMITIFNWMKDTKVPHLQLANRLFKVAEELHKLVSHEAIQNEMEEAGTEAKSSDELVTLRLWNVESSHNYENNQNITQMFYCPGAQEFHVEFDSRCETERRYDYLEFTLTRGTKIRYDQKVGSEKWPETVIFKSFDRLQFLFHSDSTTNAWGYKFTVTAKGQADVSICWVQDLQLSLASLLGKFCSKAMHQQPEDDLKEEDDEGAASLDGAEVLKQVDRWSGLFMGGLRKIQGETLSYDLTGRSATNQGDEAVLDLLQQLAGDKEETQMAKDLWERCVETSLDGNKRGAEIGGEEIDKVVRAVFAAIIWHTPSLYSPVQHHVSAEKVIPVTEDMMSAFEQAEGTRIYLVNLRQMQIKLQEAIENQSKGTETHNPEVVGKLTQHWCVQACWKKAKFLLELNPCWCTNKEISDVENDALSPRRLAGQSPVTMKEVLEMIKSPLLSAGSVRKVLISREKQARVFTEVYQLACQYLDISKDIFQDPFIIFLKQFLTPTASPKIHYMQGLHGCGPSPAKRYREAFYEFVKKLVQAVASFPVRATTTDKDNTALSCIKGFMLHHLSNDWQLEDFKFLKEISLPQLLINLAKTPDTVDVTNVEQSDISPEKQLQVYHQCQEWLKHCVEENHFKAWYDEIEQAATLEERRAMHMFVARFYERLDVNIQCDGCHSAIIGTRYRCLVCEDIDFCCSCFPGGVKVDSHTDEHPLVHLRFKCDGCHALIVGTRMHCNVCDDFDLCYGCHQTKNHPSRHKDHHVVTPIPMTVANQCKSQPQAYGQLHAWLLFSSLTLSMARVSSGTSPQGDADDSSANDMLQTCVDLILINLQTISQLENVSAGVGSSQEKVFTEKTFEKLLGLLAALIPEVKEVDTPLTEMLKLDKLLPLLFRFARETTGQYVPTQHLAVGLIGKLLGRESPKFADDCLALAEAEAEAEAERTREKKKETEVEVSEESKKEEKEIKEEPQMKEGNSEQEEEKKKEEEEVGMMKEEQEETDVEKGEEKERKEKEEQMEKGEEKEDEDKVEEKKKKTKEHETSESPSRSEVEIAGTKTVQFICSFGASCLEKCHLEWAALLPHLLMQLSKTPAWRLPIAGVLNGSFSQLPDHCSLSTIFTLFTVAGFPEVFGHGSQAIYHDINHEDNCVMVLKHFLQNGQVYIVDSKTRKTKHVAEDQLDLKSIDSQPLTSDQLVTFLNISSQVMEKLKEGTEALSVETIWALYLVLKTLHANFQPHFFEHIEEGFLPLLSFLANSQTGLSRHWLLKDLEVLSIQLYTSNRTDSIVQPLLDVSADFQVHSHQSSKPRKTVEQIIEEANASDSGSSSTSSTASSSCDDSDDTSLVAPTEFALPEEVPIVKPMSSWSEDSDDSEYHSFISERIDVNKGDVALMGKTSTPKINTASDIDPLASLDEEAQTAILSTHEALNAPLSVLRALYEISGSNVENFVQQASSSFHGDTLNVGDDVLALSKCWEPPAVPQGVDEHEAESNKENLKPFNPRQIAIPEPTQLLTSLISHSKQEMKERFKKHQREKSKDLLIKELEKHGKVGTRDFLYKINHVLSIMYARHLLVSLLADWPENGHMTISKNLGCQETTQLLNVLDLLQRTAEEDIYRKIIGVVVKHCSGDILNHLCQAACFFMQETALQPRIVESKHNYDNDTKLEGTVSLPGARYLLIKFDERCCTEDCCDILTIASDNKFKHNVRSFSGASGNWINFDIPGDTLYYKFVSDFNNNDWGFKFTVIGNHVGRFETGFVLLDSVLQCPNLISSLSLPKLWASLIEVCNKQVGHPRLKSVRLLLRILQYISREEKTRGARQESAGDESLAVDLTLLKPLWLLLNQMNNQLSEDTTTCQSIHASHSALTELFFFVENLVKAKNLVDTYIVALIDEEEIAASIRQGLCNVAAVGRAICIPNKASLLLDKEENTEKTPQASPRT